MTDYDLIVPIHLFKLASGESMIGFFFGVHEVGANGNPYALVTRSHTVHLDYDLTPWFVGLAKDQTSVMVPMSTVVAMAEGDAIDPVLIECFLGKVGYPESNQPN